MQHINDAIVINVLSAPGNHTATRRTGGDFFSHRLIAFLT
jgi:hypothetical protein